MSIAPDGPNGKEVIQISLRIPHETGRKHGKTLQKTGIILDGAQAGLSRTNTVLLS